MSISVAPGIAAGAGSTQGAGAPPDELRFPGGALVATGSGENLQVEAPGARLEDALRAAIDPTDVRTQMDAVRLLIEGDTGLRLPDLRPAHTRDADAGAFHVFPSPSETLEEPEPAPEPPPEPAGTMSFPSPAGDLSGDGLDDVLSYDIKLPQEVVEIRALRGTDGDQLWKRRLDDAADATALPASDLTGDGIDDLILLGLDVDQESSSIDCSGEDRCRVDYEATYTWTTGVLNGANGRLLWSQVYPASQDYHFLLESQEDVATETFRVEESLISSNVSVWPLLSGDHEGDGLDDLVLETIDLDFDFDYETRSTAAVVYEDLGGFQVNSATRALVVRGKDGSNLFSRSSSRGPTVAFLEPVGDLVGGPAPDLLWHDTTYTNDTYSCIGVAGVDHCSDARDSTVRFAVEAIDGTTLEDVWRHELGGLEDAFAFSLEADISGDGVDDIAQLTFDMEGPSFATRVLSGADGRSLWERRQQPDAFWWEFPLATGDLAPGPGTDVVLGSFIEETDPVSGRTDFGIRITRVDGVSGQTLFESERSVWVEPQDPPDETVALFLYRYIGWPHDADGDGVDDVFAGGIGEVLVDDGSEYLVPAETDSRAFVESSRGNSILLQQDTEDAMVFEGVADLDGDARADVFEWHYPADPFGQDPRFDLIVRRAAPGGSLWSRSLVGDEFWLGTLWTGGDHDGQPGEELLYGDNSKQSGAWKSLVGSLRGADGTARWVTGGDD